MVDFNVNFNSDNYQNQNSFWGGINGNNTAQAGNIWGGANLPPLLGNLFNFQGNMSYNLNSFLSQSLGEEGYNQYQQSLANPMASAWGLMSSIGQVNDGNGGTASLYDMANKAYADAQKAKAEGEKADSNSSDNNKADSKKDETTSKKDPVFFVSNGIRYKQTWDSSKQTYKFEAIGKADE